MSDSETETTSKRERKETHTVYEYNDLETAFYDAESDGFICSYCGDDSPVYQLHETYGCGLDLVQLKHSPRTLKRLREADCLICGLPASRWFD